MITSTELIEGLPTRELIEQLHFHRRRGETAERALGFYLLDMQHRREYLPGYRSAAHWAEDNLGYRRADKLILIAKRLEDLPEVDQAFCRGEISWTKVREICRVATSKTEGEWLELARKKTSRELEKAVRGAKRGDRPGGGLQTPRAKYCVKITLRAEEKTIWEAAVRKVRGELGKGATPRDAALAMAEMALRTDPEGKTEGRRERDEPIFAVVYHRVLKGPCSCGKCAPEDTAWIDTEDGPVAVDPQAVDDRLREGAQAIEVQDVQKTAHGEDPSDASEECHAVRFGERGQVAPEERDERVSAELKARVLARDSQCCVICGSTQRLTPHHLDSHAHGGSSGMERLVSLCVRCHAGVHEGILLLEVRADGRVTGRNPEGQVIGEPKSTADVLADASEECSLEAISKRTFSREEAPAKSDAAVPPSSFELPSLDIRSLDDLPGDITAREWRELESRLEWSPSHHAFVFRPESDLEGTPERLAGSEPTTRPRPSELVPTRPRSFDDFVAQSRVVENLLLAARAARGRGEPLGHVLLSGPPGLGKTTIARLLASECGTGLEEIVAGHIADPHQLLSLLAHLEKGGFLFLDEIHRLRGALEESLYSALEDGFIDVVLRERSRTRRIRVHLEPFTLVGATTRLGALSEPFRGRFPLKERLQPYSEGELAELVARVAERLGAPGSAEAACEVARRSRGTPRDAIHLLERARDVAQVSAPERELAHVDHGSERLRIEWVHVLEAAERLRIDARGLSLEERRVLDLLLREAKPVGLESLASRLGVDLETLRDVYEPWLERAGLVERTERGRVATQRARELYGEGDHARTATTRRRGIPIVSTRIQSVSRLRA